MNSFQDNGGGVVEKHCEKHIEHHETENHSSSQSGLLLTGIRTMLKDLRTFIFGYGSH